MKNQKFMPKVSCYRFSSTANEQPPSNCYAAQLMEKINGGGRLSREEKNYLTRAVKNNSFSRHGIPVTGWMFNFSPVLKRYLLNQYGRWYELCTADKTALRHAVYGRIHEIVEIGRA